MMFEKRGTQELSIMAERMKSIKLDSFANNDVEKATKRRKKFKKKEANLKEKLSNLICILFSKL